MRPLERHGANAPPQHSIEGWSIDPQYLLIDFEILHQLHPLWASRSACPHAVRILSVSRRWLTRRGSCFGAFSSGPVALSSAVGGPSDATAFTNLGVPVRCRRQRHLRREQRGLLHADGADASGDTSASPSTRSGSNSRSDADAHAESDTNTDTDPQPDSERMARPPAAAVLRESSGVPSRAARQRAVHQQPHGAGASALR
jgi:hypothetical protein